VFETLVQEDFSVRLTNFTRGLSPSNPPSVKKDYESGRASDKIKFKIASKKKSKLSLSVQPGKNPIKYEIIDETDRKDKKIIKSGIFMLDVKFIDTLIINNKNIKIM
jgi:hypothetical protein